MRKVLTLWRHALSVIYNPSWLGKSHLEENPFISTVTQPKKKKNKGKKDKNTYFWKIVTSQPLLQLYG